LLVVETLTSNDPGGYSFWSAIRRYEIDSAWRIALGEASSDCTIDHAISIVVAAGRYLHEFLRKESTLRNGEPHAVRVIADAETMGAIWDAAPGSKLVQGHKATDEEKLR
jgi:hypothetical protein